MSDQSITSTSAMQPTSDSSTNKRKRESFDHVGNTEGSRLTRSHGNTNGNMQGGQDGHDSAQSSPEISQIHQQLLQQVGQQNGVSPDDNAHTAKAALAAQLPHQSAYPEPPATSFDSAGSMSHGLSFGDDQNPNSNMQGIGATAAALYAAREAQSMNSKPAVGSQEWHKIRKDNHKEVERRRRETINEGINEIAKIVPGCEKNKGSILQRAVQYITQLADEKKDTQTKWAQESMISRHALDEISDQNNKIRDEANRRGEIAKKWLDRCREAGLSFEDYEDEADLHRLDPN